MLRTTFIALIILGTLKTLTARDFPQRPNNLNSAKNHDSPNNADSLNNPQNSYNLRNPYRPNYSNYPEGNIILILRCSCFMFCLFSADTKWKWNPLVSALRFPDPLKAQRTQALGSALRSPDPLKTQRTQALCRYQPSAS
jgi:hypothetical protein